MPAFEIAVWNMNRAFGHQDVHQLDAALFAPGRRLPDSLQELGVVTPGALAVVREWPESLQEAFRAVIHNGLSRNPRPPITVSFQAAYDYELRVWEPLSTVDTPGGIYIQVSCRYPFDQHPSRAYNESRRTGGRPAQA